MRHKCDATCVTWLGTAKCHCTVCSENFSVVSNFDSHRDKDTCLSPQSVGLIQNNRGTWTAKGEPDVYERLQPTGKRKVSGL
jgi:hypothetical protein